MTEATVTTAKKNQALKVEPETKVTKERKVKEFKPTHYIVFPLEHNEGIYRVKWGVEGNQTELVEASSAFEAAQKTNHPPKLGEGFAGFLVSLEKMIDGDLTIIKMDSKTKEYKIIFESVKPGIETVAVTVTTSD